MTTKGYKVFNHDFTCNGFKFEEGKEYTEYFDNNGKLVTDGRISICNYGFHFCVKASHCFSYYSFDPSNIVCEVEAFGDIQTQERDSKICTNKIRIIKKLSWDEVLKVSNDGADNTGHSNTGYSNTGNWNTGNRNTGDWNTGDWNTGNSNTGDRNTGNRNTGYWNTGNWNTGNRNTGDWNTGDWNTGNSNTGDRNTGNRNTGYWNTGNRNTGDWNTGYSNTGDRNTGNRNTGYWNTGNWNTGNRNTGDWNTGDWNTGNSNTGDRNTGNRNTGYWNTGNRNTGYWNTGYSNTGYSNTGNRNTGVFCTGQKAMEFFNKKSDWTEQMFLASKAYSLLCTLETKIWIYPSSMTEEEKKANPSWQTVDGYLKDIPFKEAFQNAWHNWSKANREAFTSLPNFDSEIFFEITGVKLI
jgi:hypothetical protein